MPSSILFIAGDPSGDQHASAVVSRTRQEFPGMPLWGIGGPAMESEGFAPVMPFAPFNRMGFLEVAAHIGFFLGAQKKAGCPHGTAPSGGTCLRGLFGIQHAHDEGRPQARDSRALVHRAHGVGMETQAGRDRWLVRIAYRDDFSFRGALFYRLQGAGFFRREPYR